MLFDTTPQAILTDTPEEVNIGSYMRGAWASFAKDPSRGLSIYEEGWPQFGTNEPSLIRLAYNNLTGTNLVQGNAMDQSCAGIPTVVSNSNKTTTASTTKPSATGSPTVVAQSLASSARLLYAWPALGVAAAVACVLA